MYLIPKPRKITNQSNDYFYLSYDTKIVMQTSYFKKSNYAATFLQEEIRRYTGLSLNIEVSSSKKMGQINLEVNEAMSNAQAYCLNINSMGITITGADVAGVLYGAATLRQILIQEGAALSYLTIEDEPALAHRGFYHDISRGRIPTIASLKELVDTLVCYKMNQLQLYVEHTFLFEEFSEVWRDDTPLTAEDIIELDAYCRERQIDLVPSISTFGHLDKVLATKSFAHLCELEHADQEQFSFDNRMEHHTIDVTNKESITFLKSMLEQYIPLFSSNYFNICADETFDLGQGKSKDYVKEQGLHHVYVEFVNQICQLVKAHGKQPMFWGDIILKEPELYRRLPEDIICLNWDYSEHVTDENTKKLTDIGATQYLCPGIHGWRHFMHRNDLGYLNVAKMCSYAHQYHAAGVLNTNWGDFGHVSDNLFSAPGIIYGAAFSWSQEIISYDEINKQISYLEYQDTSQKFVTIVSKMAMQEAFEWPYLARCATHSRTLRLQVENDRYLTEMAKFWDTVPKLDYIACNRELETQMNHLRKVLVNMDTHRRALVNVYLIHGQGQYIINKLGKLLDTYYTIGTVSDEYTVQELMEFAKEIETWFYHYKNNWRIRSRESELYHVQEVIFWAADMVRELSNQKDRIQ